MTPMPIMAGQEIRMPWTSAKLETKETPKERDRTRKVAKAKRVTNPKGKGDGHQHGEKGKDNKEKDKCPICWRAGRKVRDCWSNSTGKGKG